MQKAHLRRNILKEVRHLESSIKCSSGVRNAQIVRECPLSHEAEDSAYKGSEANHQGELSGVL